MAANSRRLPTATVSPADRPDDPFALPHDDVGRIETREGARLGRRHHRASDRVLRVALERRERRQGGLVHLEQREVALGDRPGLVEHDHVDAAQRLERAAVADEHAAARRGPDRGGDRERRRDAERAGAGDHQHGDRAQQGDAEGGATPPPPEPRRRASTTTAGTKTRDTRSTVRSIADRRPRAPSTICTMWASALACPVRVARTSIALSRFTLPPATRLPGCLPAGAASPVSSDSSTCERPATTSPSAGIRSPALHEHHLPRLERVERHQPLDAVDEQARLARHRLVHHADRARGPLARAALDHLAEQHEGDDRAGGVEVDVVAAARRLGDAVAPRGEDAEREQRLHAHDAVPQPADREPGDRPRAVEDRRRRQRHQQPRQRVADAVGRLAEVADVDRQVEHHHVQPEERGDAEAQPEVAALRVVGAGVVGRGEGVAERGERRRDPVGREVLRRVADLQQVGGEHDFGAADGRARRRAPARSARRTTRTTCRGRGTRPRASRRRPARGRRDRWRPPSAPEATRPSARLRLKSSVSRRSTPGRAMPLSRRMA